VRDFLFESLRIVGIGVCGILCLWDASEDFKRFYTEETEGREGNRRKIEAFTEVTQRAQRKAAAGVRESDGYI
jgi:hypothetical protein